MQTRMGLGLGLGMTRGGGGVYSDYADYLMADDFDSNGYALNGTFYQPVQLVPGYGFKNDGETFESGAVPNISQANGYLPDSGDKLWHNINADGSPLPDTEMLIWVRCATGTSNPANWPRALFLAKPDASQFMELSIFPSSSSMIGRVVGGTPGGFRSDAALAPTGATVWTMFAHYVSGTWRWGKKIGSAAPVWIGTALTSTMPNGLTRAVFGNQEAGPGPVPGTSWEGPIYDARILLGNFPNLTAIQTALEAAEAEVAPPFSASAFEVS